MALSQLSSWLRYEFDVVSTFPHLTGRSLIFVRWSRTTTPQTSEIVKMLNGEHHRLWQVRVIQLKNGLPYNGI